MLNQTREVVTPGWTIVGSDGKDIGDVREVGEGYLSTTRGTLLKKEIFIPEGMIDRLDAKSELVHLRIGSGQVDDMGWTSPPEPGEEALVGRTSRLESAEASVAQTGQPVGVVEPTRDRAADAESEERETGA